MHRIPAYFFLVTPWVVAATAMPAPPDRTVAPQAAASTPADLANAPSEDLLKVYAQLRSLQGSDLSAVTESVVWKRDSGTFTFKDGQLTFATPVAGHVVAAVFTGQATFELDPPTAIDRNQIERFTKEPKLEETFREAAFFFTDNTWDELQKLVTIRPGGGSAEASKVLESAQKRLSNDFNQWWENQARAHPAVHNVAARMLADLTDPSSRGFCLAYIKSDHYGELIYEISWNRDPVSLMGVSTDEEVMLFRFKHTEASEWWSGFHLKDEYAHNPHPEHRVLFAHCSDENIEAQIVKESAVTNDYHLAATADLTFQVTSATARVLPMNLEGVLRISSVVDGSGRKVSFIQEDRKQDSDPWVIMPEAVKPGDTYKLKISYEENSTRESRVISKQGSGLYFVGARTSWYPSFNAFDDRTHFTLDFHSPKKFKFVATGRLVSSQKGDELDTKWESDMPYSVVGFNYGDFVEKSHSDSNLTLTAYAGRELPDELRNISNQMDLSEMEQRSASGGRIGTTTGAQTGIMRGGFSTAAMVGQAVDLSYNAFNLYQLYFGHLPFKTISVTEQPVGNFGQSWPTLIFLPYLAFIDKTTLNSLNLQASPEQREFFDMVAMHEMSHQWWGHMVGWKTYHDQWMSEGFADFSAALYLKHVDPNRFRRFWDLRRKWLLSNDPQGHRPTDAAPLWLNYQANAYREDFLSTFLIYYKGAYVLEMLRSLMEDLRQKYPDAPFMDMMRDFVSTYAGKNASTQDFQRVVEKHAGHSMDWFFNEWVYGTAVPHYDFDYSLADAGGGKSSLHVSLRQSEVPDDFVMFVPLYFSMGGNTRQLALIPVKGNSTFQQDVPLPFRPDKVWIDEYHNILSK